MFRTPRSPARSSAAARTPVSRESRPVPVELWAVSVFSLVFSLVFAVLERGEVILGHQNSQCLSVTGQLDPLATPGAGYNIREVLACLRCSDSLCHAHESGASALRVNPLDQLISVLIVWLSCCTRCRMNQGRPRPAARHR